MLLNNIALVVSVINRTVITAIVESLKDNVHQIDSIIIEAGPYGNPP